MEVNIHHAKTNLSRLIQRAENGEDVVIARAGRPAVRLVPVSRAASTGRRELGRLAGKLSLPEDWEQQFRAMDSELEAVMEDAPLDYQPMQSRSMRRKRAR